MTDHAAEAQHHLRYLQAMNWPDGDPDASTTDIGTGRALLAIAHTLQAIHQAIESGIHPRCLAISYAPGHEQCILGRDHDDRHEGRHGFRWLTR